MVFDVSLPETDQKELPADLNIITLIQSIVYRLYWAKMEFE